MRELKDIRANDRFTEAEVGAGFVFDGLLLSGYLTLAGVKLTLSVVCGVEKNGTREWEHVSVSYCGKPNKTPSWAVMCKVKEIFWLPEEEVHQIHPKESEYLHGVGGLNNVLHLWRPVGGWIEKTV